MFLLSLQVISQSKSQNKGVVSGRVIDENSEAIPYATVSLLNQQAEFVLGAISDEDGYFVIEEAPLETLVLEVSYLGFRKFSAEVPLSKREKKIDVGAIDLAPDAQQLKEIEVTAEKSKYSLRLDKKVFEVGQDVLSQGGSAVEILDQVPLVTVDPGGTIALRGNSQVQILINGRRSGLTMNNALDQIPSANIERVEVITNPSASFDASGSAGIINIVLKKNKDEGFSGQVRAVAGVPAEYQIMPGVNYKNQNINLFGNVRWRYSDYNGIYTTEQETYDGELTSYLSMQEDEDRHDDGRSVYFGGDYYLDDDNSFTLAYYRNETKDTDVTLLDYRLGSNGTDQRVITDGNSEENRSYNQIEANYTHDFETEGEKLSIDFQNDFWDSTKDWLLETEEFSAAGENSRKIRTRSVASSKDYVLQSDYSRPIGEHSRLKVGLKGENRIVSNEYLAELKQTELWENYLGIDNDIDYAERIGAGYIEFGSQWKKIEWQLGLRGEMSAIEIDDAEGSFADSKSYFNLFPSAFASMPLNAKTSIQASYSRRINRPNLWLLYPFQEITDFNMQQIGNPNLDPTYTDGFELALLHMREKTTLSTAAYYKLHNDPFADFLFEQDGGFIAQVINIDQRDELGVELSVKQGVSEFLSISAEINAFHFESKGNHLGKDMSASGKSWTVRAMADLKLPGDLAFSTQFRYNGPEKNALFNYKSATRLDFGLSRDFLDRKLSVGARITNVLDSYRWRLESISSDYKIEQDRSRYGPRFQVNAVYRFNMSERQRIRTQNRGNR